MPEAILSVDSLEVRYRIRGEKSGRELRAVDGVSFDLEKGKMTGLVGESGSGKSTIGRAIVRLAPIHAGTIAVEGKNLVGLNDLEFKPFRRRIQMVFQDPYNTLNPRMSVGNILEEPLRIHFPDLSSEERRNRVMGYLDAVGLPSTSIHKYPHQFSGGQRQRIGIARAMTLEPEVLICDEVVSALDVSVQAQIVNLIQDLQEERSFACLFIGHDLAVIEHVSDEVLVMQKGKIVECGTPEQIYKSPKEEYTKKLLDAVPKLTGIA